MQARFHFSMALGLALFVGWLGHAPAARGDELPFLVRVGVEGAGVYSTPDGYSTGEIDPGQMVEIVRREGTEWLAIRPPSGSFDWISGREVQPDDDQVKGGTVVGRAVKVLIGTPLEVEELKVQVRLSKGDRVEILGSELVPGDTATGLETWYKIVPPPQELRWIHAADLELPAAPPAAELALASAESALPPDPAALPQAPRELNLPSTIRPVAGEAPLDERGPRPVGSTGIILEPINAAPIGPKPTTELNAPPVPLPNSAGWKPARLTAPRTSGAGTAGGTRNPAAHEWTLSDSTTPGGAASLGTPATAGGIGGAGPFQRQLEEFEVRIARTTASDPAQWKLDALRLEGERLVQAGTTLLERGRARLMLERVSELDDWRARYEKMLARQGSTAAPLPGTAALGAPTAGSPDRLPIPPGTAALPGEAPPTAGSAPPMAGVSALDTPGLPDYAGRGYLMPIVTTRPEIPRYALVNEQGQVLQFVTPAPGVNIARYLRKPVGINGRVQSLPQLNKPHLTADRVIELERHLR